jgi:hypothetical protein
VGEKKGSSPMDKARSAAWACSKVILRQIRKGCVEKRASLHVIRITSRKPRLGNPIEMSLLFAFFLRLGSDQG